MKKDEDIHVSKVCDVKDGEGKPFATVYDIHTASMCSGSGEARESRPMESKGPAKVATADYREGYDRIFGARPRGQA